MSAYLSTRACDMFIEHVEEFDNMIAAQDIREQVASEFDEDGNDARPDAGLASETLGTPDSGLGFRSITEAQREVFALHEIAQTIGSSLNLQDTVALVSSKLRAIVPFDTCIIYLVDEKSGKAVPAHVAGENIEAFANDESALAMASPDGIANSRSMCMHRLSLICGLPKRYEEHQRRARLASDREDGAFEHHALFQEPHLLYLEQSACLNPSRSMLLRRSIML